MRIAVDALNIRAGGGLTHLRELLAAVDHDRPDAEVVVFADHASAEQLPKGRHAIITPVKRGGVFSNVGRMLWRVLFLDAEVRRWGADVLLVPGGIYLGTFRPVVVMAQNLLPFEPRERARSGISMNRLRLHLLEFLQARSFRRASSVIHMSEQARQIIEDRVGLSGTSSVVVYHGVSPRFRRILRAEKPPSTEAGSPPFRWLYVSIIEAYKHQTHVAAAAGLLLREGRNLTLDFVGHGEWRFVKPLEDALKAADPSGERVRYRGRLSYDSIEQAYTNADGFVFASSCETFGMIVLEAMAAGLPVASSNRPAIPEIVSDAVLLFDPEDPVSIAGAMRRIMEDGRLRSDLAVRARRRADEFSWGKCARETMACLESAVVRYGSEPSGNQIARGKVSGNPASSGAADSSGMRVLSGEAWQDGYLDYFRHVDQLRIRPTVWCEVGRVEEQYFVPPLSWRLLVAYAKRIGPRNVIHKVISRLRERVRNKKFVSVGFGRVEEVGAAGAHFKVGQTVVFLAYNHPRCVDRLTLEPEFAGPWSESAELPADGSIKFVTGAVLSNAAALLTYGGWSRYSGKPRPGKELAAAISVAGSDLLQHINKGALTRVLTVEAGRAVREFLPPLVAWRDRPRHGTSKSACLVGLGNYAKTAILPNLDPRLNVTAIFEIDPLQLGTCGGRSRTVGLSTAPWPMEDDHWDAFFIAGYHHTHAALAVEALQRGAVAIVEKPIVTTKKQLEELRAAVAMRPGRLFACFHKRYGCMNEWIRDDLQCQPGDPIHYSCQVFEVPLPERHWYRWPNSRTRLVSNGIHWIDHFLFLNQGSTVRRREVRWLQNKECIVILELENGACFTMVLTDLGSSRIGVREYLEVKAGRRRAVIIDSADYQAEDSTRVLRRRRINPLAVYATMYREISNRVFEGRGEDEEVAFASAAVVLELEDACSTP